MPSTPKVATAAAGLAEVPLDFRSEGILPDPLDLPAGGAQLGVAA